MCFDVPEYYRVIVNYVPSDIEGIRETDERFRVLAEDEEDYLDSYGSGFGFGIRDIDFAFKTEETANKVAEQMEKLNEIEVMKDLNIEVFVSKSDNYECYLDTGCDDCYFSKDKA